MKYWRPGCRVLSDLDPLALRPALSSGLPFSGDFILSDERLAGSVQRRTVFMLLL